MNSVAVQTIQQITPQLGYEYAKEKLCHEFPCGKRYVRAHRPRRSDPRRIQLRAMRRLRVHRQRRYVQHTTLYTKILDHDGNVLIENPTESHQSVKESTAALLTSAMQSVVQAGSDGAAALDNMPVAGKTGTADNDKTSGSAASPPTTPARCGAVTTIPSPMSNIGTNFRFQIWKAIMSRVHAGLEYKDFTMPASVEQKTICTLSGQLARPGCPARTEFFATDNAPDEACTGHVIGGGSGDGTGDGTGGTTDGNTGGNTGGTPGGNTGGTTGGNTGGGTDPGTGGGTDPGTGGGTDPGTGGGTDPGTGGGTDPGTGGGTDPGTGGGTDPGTGGGTDPGTGGETTG